MAFTAWKRPCTPSSHPCVFFFCSSPEISPVSTVKTCARRESYLQGQGFFLVKDIKTCNQLLLWILKDDDTLSVLPAGVSDFASPHSPPPWGSAAVFSHFHHPKTLFPFHKFTAQISFHSWNVLENLEPQDGVPELCLQLCRFGGVLCAGS